MISRISGRITGVEENSIILEVNGIGYELLIPGGIMKCLNLPGAEAKDQETVEFITYHYYQTDPSKSIPVLIGFANSVEKEFFEKFITVSGIGPKAAVRALSEPFPEIARAIDSGDAAFLRSLPGIGLQRAREIVAKLQGRVGKFGLMQCQAHPAEAPQSVGKDIVEETIAVLLQLQYRSTEAEQMVKKAMQRNPEVRSSEELLNEVYRQKLREE